jgi:signal transduction histidine kinase
MRLRKKFVVVLLPVVIAGLALQWAVSSYTQDRQLTGQRSALLAHLLDNAAIRMLRERQLVLETYGLEAIAVYVERYQTSALDDLADLAARADVLLVVSDRNGGILQPADMAPDEVSRLGPRLAATGGAFVHDLAGEPHLIVARTFDAWGWTVAAAYPLAAIKAAIQRVNLAVTGSLVLAGLGVAVSLFVGFDRLVIRPIRQLEEKLRTVGNGRRLADLRLEGSDEIVELAAEMDAMANGIVAYTAELERSNSELDSFAATVGHDLRTPLRAIRTIVGWIEAEAASLPASVLANLDRLRDQVARIERMLQELLRYAQASQVSGPLGPCDIENLVEEQLELLAPTKTVHLTVDGMLPTLFTPEPPLALVLRNLIDNAISHHDRDEVRLHVGVARTGQRVVFRVSDDGPGIPPEARERIFDIFRAHDRRPAGCGIGLALVRRIIQRLGGQIRVEGAGTAPCRGTTFVFDWPLDCTLLPVLGGPSQSQLAPAASAGYDRAEPNGGMVDGWNTRDDRAAGAFRHQQGGDRRLERSGGDPALVRRERHRHARLHL